MLYEAFRAGKPDCEVDSAISRRIRRVSIPPRIHFKSVRDGTVSIWPVLIMGILIGTLSGLLGVGGGFILMPALVYLLGIPTKMAIGTSLVQTFFTAFFAASNHLLKGNVDPLLVFFILLGSVLGAQAGAWLNSRIDCVALRKYFGFLVLFSALVIVMKYI